MDRNILILQHADSEHAGNIAAALEREKRACVTVRIFADESIPDDPADFAGLIIMGGPMSVYEHAKYEFIQHELQLITLALEQNKPILGVCLGSQLLAAALGAKVFPGPRKEIGWHEVAKLPGGRGDVVFDALPDSFMAMHWHGDIFDLPDGAVPLLRSDLTALQAFRYGKNVYGLLCHLELTYPQIDRMVQEFHLELSQAGISGQDILNQWPRYGASLERLGGEIFSRWAALLE